MENFLTQYKRKPHFAWDGDRNVLVKEWEPGSYPKTIARSKTLLTASSEENIARTKRLEIVD